MCEELSTCIKFIRVPVSRSPRPPPPLPQISCFLNAAQASLNGKEWGDAIAHATSALGKEADNVKALYRRGVARCVRMYV